MAFDSHKNFAYSTVLTAPSPASSGTSVVVQSGDGTKFPSVSFNAAVWPAGSRPTTANAEIVRVTTISTDTFTITRAQESSSARSIVVGDQIAATVTAKTLTDVENYLNGTTTGWLTNAMLDTTAGGIGAAWQAYTPSWTSSGTAPAIGNGTLSGAYVQIGKTVHFRLLFITGSTSTFGTGNYFFTLPVAANAAYNNASVRTLLCNGYAEDKNVAGFAITHARMKASDASNFSPAYTSSAGGASSIIGATGPFTWETDADYLSISGTYEAA